MPDPRRSSAGPRRSSFRRSDGLASTLDVVRAIAAGDLTRTFDAGLRGEAAEVAEAVTALTDQLRLALTSIDHATSLVTSGAREVHEMSLAMSQTSETVAANAFNAASAATQVSSHVHSVAASAEELATTIRSVAQHAAEASSVATTASHEAQAANDTVHELQRASARVEEVVRLITNIAGQTHLLALNATIEAARAGAAGRGFAVVASEVKQLAQETADATKSVAASLHEIQGGSSQAATVMGRITQTISVVSDNQSAIAVAVEEQTAVTHEIGRSAAAVAHGSDDMSASIQALAHVARTTAYGGAQARTTAAELADIRDFLAQFTDKFTYVPVELNLVVAEAVQYDATTDNGITTIQNAVTGTGVHEWDYRGTWVHSTGNVESGGTNSYSSMPGDTARLTFHGRQVRFYGVVDGNHGIASVSVDGADPVQVDEYSATRGSGAKLWESPLLPAGEHTLTISVTGTSNPNSRYQWVTVDRAEVVL